MHRQRSRLRQAAETNEARAEPQAPGNAARVALGVCNRIHLADGYFVGGGQKIMSAAAASSP